LVFENSWKLNVQIVEENEEQVFYRKPGLVKSPLYVIDKRFITGVDYQYPDSAKFKFKPLPFVTGRHLELWVSFEDKAGQAKGVFHSISDSALYLRRQANMFVGKKKVRSESLEVFPHGRIHEIKVRKRNQMLQYSAWGALGGFAAGTLTGLIIFKNTPPCDTSFIDGRPCDSSLSSPRTKFEKSLLLGFNAAGAGFIGGGIAGAIRISFPIGGKKDAFNRTIPKLQRLARQQQKSAR
jgi:hypothetical protein